jgi:ribosomal protein S18 acetylase RimI-like enzyme
MRFPATVEPAGNATGIEIPAEIVTALGAGKRPKVAITINGHTWRSRVAPVGGRFIVGISAANRAACGIAEGERVEAELQLDTAPRLVAEPPDLAEALDSDPQARAAFDRLAYGLKRKHVRAIQDAKTPQTRQRRITKLITTIRGHHNMGEAAGPAAAAGGAPARQQPVPAPDQASSYSFRRAGPPDARAAAALVHAAYRHYVARIGITPGPMTDDYQQVIRDYHVTVAEHDAAIAGMIVLRVTEEGFLIDNVAVHPAHRGKGLGRALLDLAEAQAQRAGFGSIYLYTHEKMTENLALYSKIGYTEYDRRPQEGFSLVYMRKHLA